MRGWERWCCQSSRKPQQCPPPQADPGCGTGFCPSSQHRAGTHYNIASQICTGEGPQDSAAGPAIPSGPAGRRRAVRPAQRQEKGAKVPSTRSGVPGPCVASRRGLPPGPVMGPALRPIPAAGDLAPCQAQPLLALAAPTQACVRDGCRLLQEFCTLWRSGLQAGISLSGAPPAGAGPAASGASVPSAALLPQPPRWPLGPPSLCWATAVLAGSAGGATGVMRPQKEGESPETLQEKKPRPGTSLLLI